MSDKAIDTYAGETWERVTAQLTPLERFAVGQAYPPKLILFALGTMWSLHFIWERLWAQAAFSFLIFFSLGLLMARKADKGLLARTVLGRVFADMAQPSSLLVQLIGLIAVFFGAYVRGPFYVLIGASLVLLVHAVAWKRILNIELRDSAGK